MSGAVSTFETGGGYLRVNVEGLPSLLRFLEGSDPELRKAMQDGLADAAQPVLAKARANASRIADDGTYASSMSIAARRNGRVVLRSTDPAAGVKEFARPGAVYAPRRTDKRRNARAMRSFPVGVPKRANAPRALIPAVDDSAELVASRIAERIEQVLKEAENG